MLLISPLVFFATAQEPSTLPAGTAKVQQNEAPGVKNDTADLKKAENAERKCEIASERLAVRMEKLQELQNRHHGVYDGLITKLTNLITRLEEDGVTGPEIDALKEDIVALQELAVKLKTSYSAINGNLIRARNIVCGESQLAYNQALRESGSSINETKLVIKEIRDFYLTEIKPDLEAIREMLKPEVTEQEETETEEVEETTEPLE